MMKSKNSPLFCGLLLFCSLSFFSGCLTTQSQESANLRDVVARKNELFAKLHKELVLNKIPSGTSVETIRKGFGEPENIFVSGSASGYFEIWTYEKTQKNKELDFLNPIRLYFSDGKLISWSF